MVKRILALFAFLLVSTAIAQITITREGYWRCEATGTNHSEQKDAIEACTNAALANPDVPVYIEPPRYRVVADADAQNLMLTTDSQARSVPTPPAEVPQEFVPMQGKYLEFVGGYQIPNLTINGQALKFSNISLDRLPGTTTWLTVGKQAAVELVEPGGGLGTGNDPTMWPTMTQGRISASALTTSTVGAQGAFYIDADNILISGRLSYQSGYEPVFIAKHNLDTGTEDVLYSPTLAGGTESETRNAIQGLGGGFIRLYDSTWYNTYNNGDNFMLGRGGYDNNYSPQGPGLGQWGVGDSTFTLLMDFHDSTGTVARRDVYYMYRRDPEDDEALGNKGKLPKWYEPGTTGDGYWQAGDIGGATFIDDDDVKGFAWTANVARGRLDYRAQGNSGGNGSYFIVNDPSTFFNEPVDWDGTTGDNCRGYHCQEWWHDLYPAGGYGRMLYVAEQSVIEDVITGARSNVGVPLTYFEFPADVAWDTSLSNAEHIGDLFWDADNNYLWVSRVAPSLNRILLMAYEIVYDDERPETPIEIPTNWDWLDEYYAGGKDIMVDPYYQPAPVPLPVKGVPGQEP